MKAQNQQGSSIVQLNIFIFLSLLTALLYFVLCGIQSNYEQSIQKNMERVTTIKNQEREINDSLQEIESLTGFYTEETKASLKEINDASINIKKLVSNLNKIYNKDKENESGSWKSYGLSFINTYDAEIIEEKLDSIVYFVNLENVIYSFVQRIQELQKELQFVENESKILEQEITDKENQKKEITQKKKDILASVQQKQKDLEELYNSKLENIKDFMEKSKKEKEEASKKREEIEKKLQEKKLEFENVINKEKTEIRKLQAAKYGRTAYSDLTKQKEFEASEEKENGNIVFSDPRTQTVYIDIGKDRKAIFGLKFDVYRRAQQGKRNFIGRIEVQKVMDKVSMASVIELKNRFDPIVDGDFIINPVFREKQTIYFAFAGKMTKTTNEQAIKLIEQLGARVEPEVTARTNFIVVGEKGQDHSNYISAVTFGIPLMTEQILFKYIGD